MKMLLYDDYLANQVYLGDITVANISQRFTHEMATKTSGVDMDRKLCKAAPNQQGSLGSAVSSPVGSWGGASVAERFSCILSSFTQFILPRY